MLEHITDADLTDDRVRPEQAELDAAIADHAAHQVRIGNFIANMESPNWTPDDFMVAHRERLMEQNQSLLAQIKRLQTSTKGAQARIDPSKQQTVVRELRHKLKTLNGAELYDARAKVSAALRSIIDRVSFGYDPFGEKTVTVWVLGGAKVYVFGPDGATNTFNFVDSILAEDDSDFIASYTHGDPRREAKLRALAA